MADILGSHLHQYVHQCGPEPDKEAQSSNRSIGFMLGFLGTRDVVVKMPNRGPGDRNRYQVQRQTSRSSSRSTHPSYGTRVPKGQYGAHGSTPSYQGQDVYSLYCQQCRKQFTSPYELQRHLQTNTKHDFPYPELPPGYTRDVLDHSYPQGPQQV